MIFVYIFVGALVGMTTLLTIAARSQKTENTGLQNNDYWYSIDLVAIHEKLYIHFHRVSRPIFRSTLHKLLELYLRTVNRLRKVLRKHINALLDHYAKEHDRLYHTKPSRFIAEIQAHKHRVEQEDKDVSSLDEYSNQ